MNIQKSSEQQDRLLLSCDDLRDMGIRFSRGQLYKLIAAGAFPAPVSVSTRGRAWVASEISAWVEAKKAGRTAA
jgi:predicted DNA-binding transcriptional regulator AlpA